MKLESVIQTEIIKNLKKRKKSFTYKHCPDPTGYPDIEHMERGKCYLFEVKRSKKHKPSKIQKFRHKQLRKAGYKVYVVWSWDQVENILKSIEQVH